MFFVADYDVTTPGWKRFGRVSYQLAPERRGLWVPSVQRLRRDVKLEWTTDPVDPGEYAMIVAELELFLRRSRGISLTDDTAWQVNPGAALADLSLLFATALWVRAITREAVTGRRVRIYGDRLYRGLCPRCTSLLDVQRAGCAECRWLRAAPVASSAVTPVTAPPGDTMEGG